METIKNFFYQLQHFFTEPILDIGGSKLTLWIIIYFIILLFLLVWVSGKFKNWMINHLLVKSKIDLGVRVAVSSITRYIIIVVGFLVIFQTLGIDLSSITIIAGALGVGIGFGLQNVTNNFVSGIIILFERPIKVGDRIEVGEVTGDVVKISMRATTILTNDNISIIIPNSDFITYKVINWSHTSRNIRLNFHVNAGYNEDPEKIKMVLLEVATEEPGVLTDPKPDVLFEKFADSYMVFNLRVWTREYINRPGVLRSRLYYAIAKKFKLNNINFPNPQITLRKGKDF